MDRGDVVPKNRRQREVERLQKLFDRRPSDDGGFDFHGVLLSDAIERCVKAFGLIEPFDPQNLKAACYKLTIGDEYAIGGIIHQLPDEAEKNEIVIAPFEVAVIKTYETINMPRFLIGRWNIQVSKAYLGLIWVGGPQVDAGYVGNLFCPIYNLSEKSVSLFRGNPIAVIDFVPTSKFNHASKTYPFPPERVLFEEYEPQKLVSGLVSQAKTRLDQVENRLTEIDEKTANQINATSERSERQITSIQQRIDNFVFITFTVLAILFATLSVSAFGRESPPWQYIGLFLLSGSALFLSISAWLRSSSTERLFGRPVQVVILIGLIAACLIPWFWISGDRKHLDRLDQEIKELNARQPNSKDPATRTTEPTGETSAPSSTEKQPAVKK